MERHSWTLIRGWKFALDDRNKNVRLYYWYFLMCALLLLLPAIACAEIPADKIGHFAADRWPPAADLAVWLLSDTDDSDSTQMVRMEQMTPILHAAMRYKWAAV